MFEYCRKVLRLSEHEALNRIEAARAIRRYPALLARLESGVLSLTAVRLLAPHLTAANCEGLIREAEGKSTDAVRLLIATHNLQPPVPSIVRKLPGRRPAASPLVRDVIHVNDESAIVERQAAFLAPAQGCASPPVPASDTAPAHATAAPSTSVPTSHRAIVVPLSESTYKLQVTISAAARGRLAEIQALMRHRLPSGDPAAIVERALEVLHAELLKQKAAQVVKPRVGRSVREATGRHIPASVKREVWRRDQGRCASVAPDGTRCGSAHGVEFHHVQPYAVGGEATLENIEMRCRAQNGFEWQAHMERETLNLVEQTT